MKLFVSNILRTRSLELDINGFFESRGHLIPSFDIIHAFLSLKSIPENLLCLHFKVISTEPEHTDIIVIFGKLV